MTAFPIGRVSGLPDLSLSRLAGSWRQAWRRRRLERRTRAELHALSIREREDIGLAGADLDAVAREAVRRVRD